jgi:hypothetical protein
MQCNSLEFTEELENQKIFDFTCDLTVWHGGPFICIIVMMSDKKNLINFIEKHGFGLVNAPIKYKNDIHPLKGDNVWIMVKK